MGEGDRVRSLFESWERTVTLACQSCNVASMVSRRAARAFAGLLPAAMATKTDERSPGASAAS
jgi:hypothetical protein